MNNKPLIYSLTAVLALGTGIWQTLPLIDSLIFSEAEGADLADVSRRQWYINQRDIAQLRLKHAETEGRRSEFQAVVEYYEAKILQLDEGEK